jgi:hypothetical protein
MALIKIKSLLITGLLVLPMLSWAQTTLTQLKSSNNQQKMENKNVIGKVVVPKSSLEEFRKNQHITSDFLKALPGFLKGESYERLDDSGNLTLISVTTWLNQESYENAEKSLKEHYKSINFNTMAYRERLKIVAEHGVYSMHDY